MVNLPLSCAKTAPAAGGPFFWAAIVSVVQTKSIAMAYVKIFGPKPEDWPKFVEFSIMLPLRDQFGTVSTSAVHAIGSVSTERYWLTPKENRNWRRENGRNEVSCVGRYGCGLSTTRCASRERLGMMLRLRISETTRAGSPELSTRWSASW